MADHTCPAATRRLRPALVLILVLATAGCGEVATSVVAPAPPTTAPMPVATASAPPAAAMELPVVPPDAATGRPLATPEDPEQPVGSDSMVLEAQRRLADLRYYGGEPDGLTGPATTTAVQAFQKVQGLPVDGLLGEATLAALQDPAVPALHAGLPERLEVDLDLQVMYVVLGGELARVLPISSGDGAPYDLPGGGRARSVTPIGTFAIERRVPGVIDAYFGTLYDAMYFHSGWAIHGSGNVPPVPASHGCIRVPRPDAAWLYDQVGVGTVVQIRGSRNAFNPAAGETAGTDRPAGEVVPPPAGGPTTSGTPPVMLGTG